MKKLLTILAASAMFFAFGEGISNGINFETYTAGEGFDANANDPGTNVYFWCTASSEGNVISNHVSGTLENVTVPDMFSQDGSNNNFLYLETEAPLFRTVAPNTHNVSNFTGVSITENPIYLDTLVKFTAADSAFTSFEDAADKIAIEYVEHEEESHEDQTTGETVIDSYGFTNFVIRAGFIASSTALVATNYVVALPDGWLENNKKDAWHRLTVRTLTNIDGHDRVGFKIYLDETPMVYITDDAPKYADFAKGAGIDDDTHTIFPSAVETDKNNYNEISAVAFSGNGSIDDVVFTTTKPKFIAESEAVVVPFVADVGVTAISVLPDGATDAILVDMTADTLSAQLPAQTTAFTVTATIDTANGYEFVSMTVGDAVYNTNPASVTGYAGGDITITTTRNNFNLFDADGNAITTGAPFQTLSAALAADGVAKIVLAHNYEVTTEEAASEQEIYTIDGNIVLDLNGKTLDGGEGNGFELFYVTGSLKVIDSVGGGKIVYGGNVFGAEGSLLIGDVSGDNGVTIDGVLFNDQAPGYIIRGNVLAEGNTDGEGAFLWNLGDGEDIESEANLVGDYWVVTPDGGSEPTQIQVPTAATTLVYDGTEQTGVAAGTGYTLSGTAAATDAGEYTATATPASGFAWVGGSTEATNITWSIAKATVTATVSLTVTEATYDSTKTTVTDYTTPSVNFGLGAPELVENTDYTVAWSATEVTGAGTFTYTVSPVADSNYTFTETSATLTITASGEEDWPTGTDLDDLEGKAVQDVYSGLSADFDKVDAKTFVTWASGVGGVAYADKGTTTFNIDCFLLNIANASTEQQIEAATATAAEAIKITSITIGADGKPVITTANDTYGNGVVVIEGSASLEPISWHEKTDSDHFFHAKLVVDEVVTPEP